MDSTITAGKIAEEVRNVLSGGEGKPEVVPTRRQALYAVQQARNKVIFDFMWAMKGAGEHTVPFDLIDEKEVELLPYKDNAMYIPLENRVLSGLPKNIGLFQLTTNDFPPQEIIPAPPSFLTLYQNQNSFSMEGNPYYIPVKDNLYVYGIGGKGCKLNMRAIFAGETYGEHDFFCITPEMETDVVEMAIKMLGLMREIPEDRITDNTKN